MAHEEKLIEWKKQYGYVYFTEVNGNEFIFRLLGNKEYETLQSACTDLTDLDEKIAQLCVLYPEIDDWSTSIYAGYTTAIGQAIREESLITPKEDGSGDFKTIIEQETLKLDNLFAAQMPLIIKHAFPEYTLADLENLSMRAQIELYAKAAWMAKTFDGLEFSFTDEE